VFETNLKRILRAVKEDKIRNDNKLFNKLKQAGMWQVASSTPGMTGLRRCWSARRCGLRSRR
jgi:hypothetical protein